MFSTDDLTDTEKNIIDKDIRTICQLLAAKTQVPELVDNYKRFLDVNYPNHVKPFSTRLGDQPESARAEAAVYSFFEANHLDVQVEEDIVKGGVDFRCKTDKAEFVAEVTCLEAESVTRESGVPNEPSEDGSGYYYNMITPLLRRKASEKASQMSGYSCPRLLVITCEHNEAVGLLDMSGAEFLLTSESKIAIPSNPGEDIDLVTDLKQSAFFRVKNGKLESCRQSISAILLFTISAVNAFVVGILHPDPVYKFPIELLSSVPFLRLKKWPPENDRIEVESVNHKWKLERFWYDKDLRYT